MRKGKCNEICKTTGKRCPVDAYIGGKCLTHFKKHRVWKPRPKILNVRV